VTDHGCHPITPPVRSCAVCGYWGRFVARFPRQTGRWETTDPRRMFKKLRFRV